MPGICTFLEYMTYTFRHSAPQYDREGNTYMQVAGGHWERLVSSLYSVDDSETRPGDYLDYSPKELARSVWCDIRDIRDSMNSYHEAFF